MADGDRDRPAGLDDLGARLKAARDVAGGQEGRPRLDSAPPPGLVAMAMRAGVEMVAGVAVGAALGYGLDVWLDTSPWLLILCFVLGSAAGMLNAYRSMSGVGMALGYRNDAKAKGAKIDEADGDR